MRVTTFSLLVLVCLFAVSTVGLAQEPAAGNPAISHVAIGYSKNVRSGSWIPVRLTIENPGPAAEAEVVLSNQEAEGQRLPGMTRTRVHLPARSVRRHTTYMQDQGGENFVFELRVDGRRVDQLMEEPIRASQRQSFMLGLSVHGGQPTCDTKQDVVGLMDQLQFAYIPNMPALPDRWQALTALDAIILGDLPEEELSVSQEQAIVDWVRSGGVLILCPGATDERYEDSLFAAFSPVRIVGKREVSSLPPWEQKYAPLDGSGLAVRVPLSEVVVMDGTVHMQMGQLPLVVSRREGLGRVVFVAFDLSYHAVEASENLLFFYQDLMALRTGLPGVDRVKLPETASGVLDETMGVPVLSRWMLGVCLGLNFLFVGGVLFWKSRRRELGFALLVVSAPLIAVILSFLGQRVADVPETAIGAVNVVSSASEDSFGVGSGYYALLSQGEERWDVAFPDENRCFPGVISALRSENASSQAAVDAFSEVLEVEDGDSQGINQFHVLPRALAKFQTNYATDLDGSIHARVSYDEKGLEVHVTNDSEKVLKDVFVVCNRNMAPIENLSPGESTRARLDSGSAAGLLGGFSRRTITIKSKEEVHRDRIVRSLYTSRNLAKLADTGILVCGWFDDAPPRMHPAGIPATAHLRSETLWIVKAEPEHPTGEVLLPKGTPALRFRSLRGQPIQDGQWVTLAGKHVMEVSFQVPEVLKGLKVERATLFFQTEQAPAQACLKVYNVETDIYDTIAPAGDGEEMQILDKDAFELARPERYLSAERGEVRVIVEVESASSAEGMTTDIRNPIIKDFDMEVQGICP